MNIERDVNYLLNNCNGILIGSRAFDVHNTFSDYDIAIKFSNLPNNYRNKNRLNIKRYFTHLPLGNSFLVRTGKLDLIVFHENADFNIIKEAVNRVKRIPKEYLADRHIRVALFEYELDKLGFIKSDTQLPF